MTSEGSNPGNSSLFWPSQASRVSILKWICLILSFSNPCSFVWRMTSALCPLTFIEVIFCCRHFTLKGRWFLKTSWLSSHVLTPSEGYLSQIVMPNVCREGVRLCPLETPVGGSLGFPDWALLCGLYASCITGVRVWSAAARSGSVEVDFIQCLIQLAPLTGDC